MIAGHLPWGALGLAFGLCLAVSALGFLRTDWFISIGYGFSVAAQAALYALLYRDALSPVLVLQLLLYLAYGLRLGGYLVARERAASFAGELGASKARSAGLAGPLKPVIWVAVSALYVAMVSPLLSGLAMPAGAASPTLLPGIAVMALGLLLEAAADAQKARLKKRAPGDFARTGLYAIVRCPNYLGEMLFWFGGFVAALGSYASLAAVLLALAGLVCIELIMLGAARRLESKQAGRYGSDPAYQSYVRRVPILFPLVPLYSLRTLRVYLG
jgi:steroid 5-alpha reductase family enzyme